MAHPNPQNPITSGSLAPPSLSDFKPFCRLPLKLRRKIWKIATAHLEVQPNICIFPPHFDSELESDLTVHQSYITLLATSREARQVALKHFSFTRAYNTRTDILYLDDSSFYVFCGRCYNWDWARSIRHIALASSVSERGAWLPIAMQSLSSLEILSIVYPKSTGVVDRLEPTVLPNRPDWILRPLTVDEQDALIIKADFWVESFFGWDRIVWSKSATTHLRFIQSELTQDARQYMPACWDKDTSSLKLSFEAQCFIQ
ncbi:hypothetical protein FSHL1_002671 [Fusarium sambucinum]